MIFLALLLVHVPMLLLLCVCLEYMYSELQIRLRIAYLRNFVDLKTQLNSFLCVQKRNKNPLNSIPKFFVAYDAIVFSL